MKLADRVAVIAGGANGIGLCAAVSPRWAPATGIDLQAARA